MHDLNFAAFTILRALLQTQPARFCGVGDFDQVVHQANGAERKFMEKGVDFGNERRIDFPPLKATRRFGIPLARAAGRLTNKKYSSETEHKTQIACRAYADDGAFDCAFRVAVAVEHWIEQCTGKSPNLVILLRHSHQSVSISWSLLSRHFAVPICRIAMTSASRRTSGSRRPSTTSPTIRRRWGVFGAPSACQRRPCNG